MHQYCSVLSCEPIQGPVHYVSLVAEIAPSLPELRVAPGSQGIFVQRLKFTVRYAEFHRRKMERDTENALLDLVSIFIEDLAPRAWWGILLYDAITFLEDGAVIQPECFLPSDTSPQNENWSFPRLTLVYYSKGLRRSF